MLDAESVSFNAPPMLYSMLNFLTLKVEHAVGFPMSKFFT